MMYNASYSVFITELGALFFMQIAELVTEYILVCQIKRILKQNYKRV